MTDASNYAVDNVLVGCNFFSVVKEETCCENRSFSGLRKVSTTRCKGDGNRAVITIGTPDGDAGFLD